MHELMKYSIFEHNQRITCDSSEGTENSKRVNINASKNTSRHPLVARSRTNTVSSLCSDVSLSPYYLADSICRVADVEGRRQLRSSATRTLLVLPVRRSILGDRSFPVATPRAWNSLPSAVRTSPSLITFRRELKTFLYHSSFVDC